jgi:hypothetical protein
MRSQISVLVIGLMLLVHPAAGFSWGSEGHEIVALSACASRGCSTRRCGKDRIGKSRSTTADQAGGDIDRKAENRRIEEK